MRPVLVRIFGFDIAFYGPLISLGVLLGVYFAVRRAKKVGLPSELILDLTFYSVIIGLIGSRVFFILNDLPGFVASPRDYIFTRQGYVFFGGLIFALVFAIWFLRRKGSDLWLVGDVMAPSIALGHMFGRSGCFFSGCCYGRICPPGWESWGVSFPKVTDPATGDLMFSFAWIDHVKRGLIPLEATQSLPVFPTQLYEAGANFLIFLGLMWLWRYWRFRGQIFLAYLGVYGAMRFLLEFARGDYSDPAAFGLLQRGHVSQIICLAAIVAAVVLWRRLRHRPLPAQLAEQLAGAVSAPNDQAKPQTAAKRKRQVPRNSA